MREVKNVFGSIDDDKDPRFVGQGDSTGDYIAALNIRNSASTGQQTGRIESVKGARFVDVPLPVGTNVCIMQCSDPENKYLYFGIANSLGNDTIYRYSYTEETPNPVEIILRTSELKFSPDHYIVGARVIGGQLFFNDALNEPRCIDIEACRLFQEPPVIWEFFFTGTFGAVAAILQGTTPPPFNIGDVIYVRRDFRRAWVDAVEAQPDEDTEPGYYYLARGHCYDPNPQVSGARTITDIIGNNVFLDVPLDPNTFPNYEFLIPLPSTAGGIPGVAYLHDPNRQFNAPFIERYIKLYRAAPHFPVCTKYDTDSSISSNNLRGRLFQFKYRWVYRHGMKSHFSPICKTALPELEKALTPFGDYQASFDNVINLWFDSGDTDVVGIEVAVKVMSSQGDQNFYLLDYIDKELDGINSNTSAQLRFYGNEVFRSLDPAEASQPMDEIPLRTNDMCLFQDKRLAVGAVEEGFDHYEVESEMVPQIGFGDGRGFEITNPFPDDAPDNTTQLWEARFPLNRIVQYNNTGDFLWGSANYPGNSAIIYPGDPPNTSATIFPGLLHPGEVVSENAWQVIDFAQDLIPLEPNITSDGVFTFLNFKIRISKSIWANWGFPGPLRYTYLSSPSGTPLNFTNFLSYADPNNFGNSFFYMSKQYIKILDAADTAESVRDHFLFQIMNAEPMEQTFLVKVELNGAPGDAAAEWYFNATVRLEAFETNEVIAGQPYGVFAGGTNLYIRPRMTLVPVPGIGNPSAAPIDLREFYRILGVNKLSIAAGTSANRNLIGFKTGANHPIAIEYRDDVGRRWPLTPVGVKYISYFNENEGYGAYNVDLLIKILGSPPVGATHYQMMYAGNTAMQKWLQFEVNRVEFNTTSGVIEVSLFDRLSLYNRYNNGNLTAGQGRANLSYTWSPGDRMRIMTLWGEEAPENETPAPEYIDVEIIGESTLPSPQGLTLFLELDGVTPYLETLNNNFFFAEGSVVEVYTPRVNASDEQLFYYEIGKVFKITNGQHHGNQLNQGPDTPGSNNPFAQILLKNVGDAYVNIRPRIPADFGATPPDINKSKDRTLETSNYSDFYPSEGWGPGIPNRIDRQAKRAFKANLIRFSDVYIAGTRVNQLNRFYGGNLSDAPDAIYGPIQRMLCPDKALYVFQQLNTGTMPVRATEMSTATGNAVLFRSDNVLGDILYMQGDFGIGNHRESLVYQAGNFYHANAINGQYMRLSGEGYFPISKMKRDNYFQQIFNWINKSGSYVRILSAYDVKYDELIVCIPDIFNYNPQPTFGNEGDPSGTLFEKVFDKTTLAYSESKRGWVTPYAYWPDNIGRHYSKLMTWKAGKLYVHDETDEWNKFHQADEAQPSVIKLVFNEQATATKFLQSIGLLSNTEADEVVFTTPYGAGQQSSLFKEDFVYMENQYYAAVLRDELTPVDNAVTQGDVIRGEYYIVELTFLPDRKFELFAVTLRHTVSEMSGR
jgi:hypothetical protein